MTPIEFVTKWTPYLKDSAPQNKDTVDSNYIAWCLFFLNEVSVSPFLTDAELLECAHDWASTGNTSETLDFVITCLLQRVTMTDSELLESIRASLQLGLAEIKSDINTVGTGLVFFDEVPPMLLKGREKTIEAGGGGEQWFLITDRPRGLEWKDDILDHCGLWIVEVENVETIRNDLQRIKPGCGKFGKVESNE